MRGTGYWGISYQLSVVSCREWKLSESRIGADCTDDADYRIVIPFLKVYIALTAPERTDSQSMLQGGTDSQSMLQFQSEMVLSVVSHCLKQDLQDL